MWASDAGRSPVPTKMSAEAEESSGNLVPVPAAVCTAQKPKHTCSYLGDAVEYLLVQVFVKERILGAFIKYVVKELMESCGY